MATLGSCLVTEFVIFVLTLNQFPPEGELNRDKNLHDDKGFSTTGLVKSKFP